MHGMQFMTSNHLAEYFAIMLYYRMTAGFLTWGYHMQRAFLQQLAYDKVVLTQLQVAVGKWADCSQFIILEYRSSTGLLYTYAVDLNQVTQANTVRSGSGKVG